MEQAFVDAKPILNTLKKHGFEAYFVGGAVRDAIMGKEVHDVDIATSANPETVQSLFMHVIPVGVEHGTVIVRFNDQSYEVTTFRKEANYHDYRHPDHVTFIDDLHEDLKRRDFTMNALAMTSEGDLIDPFSGQKDIEKRIIRTVGSPYERFREDPLRMLRALRFMSQLNFTLEENTLSAIKKMAPYLSHLSIERIAQEFEKLMLGRACEKALVQLLKLQIHVHLPCLSKQTRALERLTTLPVSRLENDREIWALLLLVTNMKPEPFLKAWKRSNQLSNDVKAILRELRNDDLSIWDPYRFYRLGYPLSISYIKLRTMIDRDHRNLDACLKKAHDLYKALPIKNRSELAVNGNDFVALFNKKPGKWLGEMLQKAERAVVQGEVANDERELKEWGKRWLNRSEKNC